ncbi:unnamed protein product [Mesocestoides corti]|uniref:C2H2-type domain-containing protein n=4 Tax=Mesocestoides corti TaxID=53468 RepID=A0A158QTH5_MESCO|nr:unnamed protein product [Mesocestoides corti]
MLDADSVFERLLREATNLVPKMSTPKLSAALKVSSTLQQRITDTLSTRLRQEEGIVSGVQAKAFGVQGVQSIVRTPMLSDDIISDNTFLAPNDAQFANRAVSSANYTAIPFFPQLNQFVGQRTATLVTITNPHSGATSGAVVGTLAPPPPSTSVTSASTTQSVIVPLQTPAQPPENPVLQSPPPSTTDGSCGLTSAAGGTDGCPSPMIATAVSGIVTSVAPACAPNGHILTAAGLECVDLKPDPTACLSRLATGETSLFTSTTEYAGTTITTNSPLNFLQASTPVDTLPSSPPISTAPSTDGVTIAASPTSTVVAPTTTTVVVMTSASVNQGSVNCAGSAPAIKVGGCGGSSAGGPYRCMHCGKEFRVLRYLEKHKRIHTGEKPYQCCYCGRQFNDWPNMNRHKRIHTGERPYRCSVCTKTFSQPAVYNEHIKRHTGERPYVCTVCAKGFPRAARLAVHMRVHTGERPYRCHVCDRRFSQPHHLSTHVRIHSGDRPFRFTIRDNNVGNSSNLRRHRKQAHSAENPASSNVQPKALTNVAVNRESAATSDVAAAQRRIVAADGSGTQTDSTCPAGTPIRKVQVESAQHPAANDSRLSRDGDPQSETCSPVDTSATGIVEGAASSLVDRKGVSLSSSSPLSSSTAASAASSAPSETLNSQAQHLSAVAAATSSENFCSQPQPPPSIFDANGTIYISTMDGANASGTVSTALVPATSTITSTLPQIQIHHQQPTAFATATFADPHHLQPQPIQICYSTAVPGAGDSPTIILPSKTQMFGPMLVPIGSTGPPTPAFPYSANGPTAFQARTLPPPAPQPSLQSSATQSEATPRPTAGGSEAPIPANV